MSARGIVRALTYAVVVAGIIQLTLATVTGERPNADSFVPGFVPGDGFVPGVVLGYVLLASGWLLLGLEGLIRDRAYGWRLALLVVLTVWLVGGSFLAVWAPPDWARDLPLAPLLAAASWTGVLGVVMGVVLGGIVLLLTALAWLADQVPFLRRHGAGEDIRRQRGLPTRWLSKPRSG